jgi:anti-sigma regulatory factor (Ser/Thr protein kinase)
MRAKFTSGSLRPVPGYPDLDAAGLSAPGAAGMSGFHHEALFYESDDEYIAGAMPGIHSTLADDGTVLVAVGADKRRLLRAALGDDAGRVAFAEMEEVGRNPARIISVWRDFLRRADGRAALGIGEPAWPGRSDAELNECSRHEALLNLAFGDDRDWRLLCPYDAAALPSAVLDEACRNHPHLRSHGLSTPSGDFGMAQAWDAELPAPAREPAELAFTASDLPLVRQFTGDRARDAGIVEDRRIGDLVLAVYELATNSTRHGGGSGVLRTWEEGDTFLCEIRDSGHIADPLAGRDRRVDDRGGGRGLWIVNHLCDLVQVRSSPDGTVVRLQMDLI